MAKAAPSRTTSDPLSNAPHHPDDDESSSEHGITFHTSTDTDYKFGCVYWRHGFSLPENGRMRLSDEALSFKGIIGTKLSFALRDVEITKASRMGGLVHDAFIINDSSAAEEGGKFLFSTVMKDRKKVIDKMQSAIANTKLKNEGEEDGCDDIPGQGGTRDNNKKFRMPPDEMLQKMDIIANKKLKGVSLQDYYDVAWSDTHKPMYGPFLEQQGKDNVTVSKWQSGEYKGEWCGESYTEERNVTFNFMKRTIGQTLVNVKHTQRCRRIGNDQVIVHIKMEMKGFPYADAFVVEVRHVTSRIGENDLSIQIGMFVRFLKSCFVQGKIKSNTGLETTKAQLALLDMVLEGCAPYAKEVEGTQDESEDEEEPETALTLTTTASTTHELPEPIFKILRIIVLASITFFRTCLRPYLPSKLFDPFSPASVEDGITNVREHMKYLEQISLKSISQGQGNNVLQEIASIEKSLCKIEKLCIKKR